MSLYDFYINYINFPNEIITYWEGWFITCTILVIILSIQDRLATPNPPNEDIPSCVGIPIVAIVVSLGWFVLVPLTLVIGCFACLSWGVMFLMRGKITSREDDLL